MAGERRLGVALGLVLLGACGTSGEAASTGLLLEVDADAATRHRVVRLAVEVQGRASGTDEWSVPAAFDIEVSDPLDWPRRAAIQPKGDPVGRGVRVVVRGYAAGDEVPLVVARAATTFLRGRWLLLQVQLQERCHRVACGPEESCEQGACRPAWRPARDLPDVFAPEPTPGAASRGGGDGGTGEAGGGG